MPEADLALIEAAARAAGEIALARLGRPGEIVQKPGGAGPVTEADLEIDRMLKAELTAARPDYGWLSEESPDDPARLAAGRAFIVDPIDGTRAFISGGRAWGHALAVAERGRVVAAVMHMPALERTYAAEAGGGACRDGVPVTARDGAGPDGAEVLIAARHLGAEFWPGGVPAITRGFRPSLVYMLCLVAEGRWDAAISFRDVAEWDAATGALIATEAGAVVSDRRGRLPRFNRPAPVLDGLVAAGPALHRALVARATGS